VISSFHLIGNYHFIINCELLQNTIWVCNKFVVVTVNCYLVRLSSYATDKCNAEDTLGITPIDEKIIYMGCLEGHISNPFNGGILDLDS